MSFISRRLDEKEILKIYNIKTIFNYFNSRKKGTLFNTFLAVPHLRNVLKKEINGKDVLDVGCGFGEDILWCLNNGVKLIDGLEINPDIIKIVKKNTALENISIYNKSAYDAGSLNKKYDLIYSNMVFDQVKDLDFVFKIFNNILNPRGKVIFTAAHPLNVVTKNYSEKIMDYFSKGKTYHSPKSLGCKIPLYLRTFGYYSKIFHNNGFCIEKMLEPKPLKSSKKKFLSDYSKYSKLPGLVIFSVVKK